MMAARTACLAVLLLVIAAARAAGQPADAAAPAATTTAADEEEADTGWEWSFDALVDWFESDSARTVLQALLGLLVFLAGWPIARLLSAGAFRLARRITADPKLVSLAGLPPQGGAPPELAEPLGPPEHRGEAMVARVVFLLAMCAAFLAGLYVSDLTSVSEPLARFSVAVEEALPLVARAGVILFISWIAARMLRRGVTSGLRRMHVDQRLGGGRDEAAPPAAAQPERAFSDQVGQVAYWLVLAFGLAATVESLEFVPLSTPIRDALDRIIALLPAIGSALIILAGGGLLAWLARRVVRSLLEAAGFDRLLRRIDVGRTLERVSPSALAGLAAMLFVLAEAVIAALDQLHLDGLSAPMTAAMTEIGAALPDVGLGLLILLVGHFAGRLARRWVERAVDEIRLDAVLERIGVLRDISGDPPSTSSRALGVAAHVLILLVAAQQAFAAAGLTVWAGHVSALLAFAVERVGVAALIVLAGFALGTQARNQIVARGIGGAETTSWVGGAARIMVLVFAFTMAIHHLGVAERFVTMAFGFAFGGLCLALALAFGLGGRELTAELLRRRLAELTEAKRRSQGEPPEGAD